MGTGKGEEQVIKGREWGKKIRERRKGEEKTVRERRRGIGWGR